MLVTHSRWGNGGYLKCWQITEVVQIPTRALEEKDRFFLYQQPETLGFHCNVG